MTDTNEERTRLAVKRSVHFVLPDDFARTLLNVVGQYTREFWRYLDEPSKTRKKVRNAAWTVWGNAGLDTVDVPFTHQTRIIVDKDKPLVYLKLKETAGKLTDLTRVVAPEQVGDDQYDKINKQLFEHVWLELLKHQGVYPGPLRPVAVPVAQVIAGKYNVPMAVLLFSLNTRMLPSHLSNGVIELARRTMPGETFPENVVEAAMKAGEVERVSYWTFKVKPKHYQEWLLRTQTTPIIIPR